MRCHASKALEWTWQSRVQTETGAQSQDGTQSWAARYRWWEDPARVGRAGKVCLLGLAGSISRVEMRQCKNVGAAGDVKSKS